MPSSSSPSTPASPSHHDLRHWRVEPGRKFALSEVDPRSTPGAPGNKQETEALTQVLRERLYDLQAALFAEGRHALLLVLQAMDCGGKDGTIRSVFHGVNPLGVRVEGFGVPTEEELDHDFLWRIHQKVPGKGRIGIFNRSHYEDVLVVRVKGIAPESVWRPRYKAIEHFESGLAASGTAIVKVMLHISKDEQRERLQDRVDDPKKRWKYRAGDLEDRALWDEYMKAYDDAVERTSTDEAPWYVVPADRNWYRDWAVLSILVATLEALGPQYPDHPELEGTTIE